MASKDIKYLGFGLGIGIAIMSLFIGTAFFIPEIRNQILPQESSQTLLPAMATQEFVVPEISSQEPINVFTDPAVITQTPESINTLEAILNATSTSMIVDTPLPLVNPTLTAAELLAGNGELSITGPLTRYQQLNLYNSSLTFIAPTYTESKAMSVAINNLRFSDPSTTCGPLAVAILKKAGIINIDNVPHDFFLINPDNVIDRRLLEKTFPADHYTDTRYKIKLNKINWVTQPLFPGDFLYIYSGEEGNFEHMLVVTRVDSEGRAYSVTNYNLGQGFIINEVLLYDPADSAAGIFAQWTKRKDQLLGSTGFAGYEVWRFTQ